MLIIDRESFIAWTEGVLLDRDENKKVLVGDDTKNVRAEAALQKGKIVGLTVAGKLVSMMSLEKGKYVERAV